MAYDHAEYQLLIAAGATGPNVKWAGGRGVFTLYAGTLGGATVTMQWSPDKGANWLNVDRSDDNFVTLTALGSGKFELPRCLIRAAVSGGSPSGLMAKAFGIDE